MISRLKPKANPLTWANIRFPGATPTRHQNSEWCPFTTWHCLYKVKQPGKMLVIKFSRDSSSPETRILTRNHICMMKKKKQKQNNHQMQVDQMKSEGFQLISWEKKCQMEFHVWVQLGETCFRILRKQKNPKRRQNKVRSRTFSTRRPAMRRPLWRCHLCFLQ